MNSTSASYYNESSDNEEKLSVVDNIISDMFRRLEMLLD